MTIGFVDDQQDILDLYKDTFHSEGVLLQTWLFDMSEKERLIQDITQQAPDVLLLDYHIDNWYKGRDLANKLTQVGYEGVMIGFSTDTYTQPLFERVGVKNFVHKNLAKPGQSVSEVLRFMDSCLDKGLQ